MGRFGINMVCAVDADDGFRKLNREDPDLILLDVMLPGKDGFEICREIRKTSNLPIIMLTARGDVIDRVSGLEIGAVLGVGGERRQGDSQDTQQRKESGRVHRYSRIGCRIESARVRLCAGRLADSVGIPGDG